jgi:hypothetical protein
MQEHERDLHPQSGVRFLLELASAESGVRATYAATIYLPDAEHRSLAKLGDDGSVEMTPTGADPGLDEKLAAQARLIARDASKRRADGLPPWPRRVLRWRK